ncbi:MAG: ABC transporter ATP-binding protein [Proteobacteria bacterium]|nr:ABC transporter ATP-binding protein [Pseudomonadota bacterium]
MNGSLLSVRNISADLANRAVLQNLSFDVADGEFFSLLGPSGCGKTTLLKIVAGFLQPASGELLWNGRSITGLPPQQRDLNLVFQNYALFPHMNVFDNVAFGLRMKKLPPAEISERAHEALELVRMKPFAQRRINELSGGQQQRVALARAVAPRPKLVLLDEPLGALDLQLRKQMQIELKSLQRQLGMTFIYVTHDQEEAFAMSDRIAILNQGRLEQEGSPEILYKEPASRFVARFIGNANFLNAAAADGLKANCPALQTDVEIIPFAKAAATAQPNQTALTQGVLLVRPEQLELSPCPPESTVRANGEVLMRQYLGAQIRYFVRLQDDSDSQVAVDVHSSEHSLLENGSKVNLFIRAQRIPFYADVQTP